MDGVLVTGYETPPAVYRAATERTIRAFGRAVEDIDDVASLQRPASSAEFREACSNHSLPPEAAWGYRERVASDLAKTRLDQGDRPPHADTDVLETLAREYALGICSNNRHETVADCIDIFGWTEAIEEYRGRFPALEDFDQRKPKPAYLEWVMDRIGVHAPLFVGDRISDVQTAERVGCDAALLTRDDKPGTVAPTFHIETLTDLVTLHRAGWADHDAVDVPHQTDAVE